MKDPAGTIHSYSYDQHGRLLHDRVTALPAALDGTVRRISRSYDAAGRWTRISSWDRDYLTAPAGQPAPVAVNEVKLETNAWGQLIADRQAHSGLVDAASPAVPVGSVQYGYANGAANHLRRTSLTMPSGRQVLTDYDAGFDDRLSRFTRLRLADGVGYTPVLTQIYAGEGRVVRMNYPQPQLQWTLLAQTGENTLSNKAPYTGLDRFGRMIQARWLTASATGTPQTRVHVRYWYDRGSRRIWRDTPNAPAGSKEAEGYTYDGLSQVTGRQRGQLQFDPQGAITGIAAPPEREEAFRYDTLGNWQRYTVKEPDLTNPPAQISVLDQARSHNPSNQITGFSNSTEPVTHDPAGNTTRTAPSPSGDWSKSVKYVWDAWNRLVAVLDASSSDAEIARHAYDGITRRTWLREGGTSGTVRHFFYNDQWRSVEERIGTSGNAERQHVFHPANRWHLILRDRNADGVGTSLDERLYSLHDAMDPVAIADPSGAVVERYSYSAFGQRRVMDAAFANQAEGTSKAWNWEFHAEFSDCVSGSFSYGARDFTSRLGNWISRDPIYEADGVNLYRYAANRPTNGIDYLGFHFDGYPADSPNCEVRLRHSHGPNSAKAWWMKTISGPVQKMIVDAGKTPTDPSAYNCFFGRAAVLACSLSKASLGGTGIWISGVKDAYGDLPASETNTGIIGFDEAGFDGTISSNGGNPVLPQDQKDAYVKYILASWKAALEEGQALSEKCKKSTCCKCKMISVIFDVANDATVGANRKATTSTWNAASGWARKNFADFGYGTASTIRAAEALKQYPNLQENPIKDLGLPLIPKSGEVITFNTK